MSIRDASLDKVLTDIADNCDELLYCSDASIAAGALKSAVTVLGTVALTVGDGNGDYAIADYAGTGGGRKLTLAAKNVIAAENGTSKSWALCDGTTIYSADTHNDKVLVSGQTYEGPAFIAAVIKDPTSITA